MARGRPRYKVTDKDRATVKAMTGYGIKQDDVARVIGISDVTLRKHFAAELDGAIAEANAAVAQSLFQMATKGKQVAAAIFWMKARGGWREISETEVSGKAGAPIEFRFRWEDSPTQHPSAEPVRE